MKKQSAFWRLTFLGFFVFSMVDGFVSNLLFPLKLPLLFKDILLTFVYFFFLIQDDAKRYFSELYEVVGFIPWILGVLFFVIGVCQVFNPYSAGLSIGLLGLKVSFFYWPLALLVYAYVDSLEKARKFLKVIAVASIFVNLFGLFQFTKDPSYMVSTFGPGFIQASMYAQLENYQEKSFLRVLGTFASSGQYAAFLIMNAMICFALFFTSERRNEKAFWIVCNLMNFSCLLATGSRGSVFNLTAILLVFALISRKPRYVMIMFIISVLSVVGGFKWLGSGVVHRYDTARQWKVIKDRSYGTTGQMVLKYLEKYPMGQGLGSASNASRHLASLETTYKFQLVENFPSKLLYEVGAPGMIVFYLFLIALMFRWKGWLPMWDDRAKDIMLSITAYCFAQFGIIQLFGGLDTPPTSIFIWTFAGLAAKLTRLYGYKYSRPGEVTPTA